MRMTIIETAKIASSPLGAISPHRKDFIKMELMLA